MSRRKIPGDWVKRADGTQAWKLPYRDDTGIQRTRRFDTKGDAEVFYDDLMAGVRSGTWIAPDAGSELFSDFARQWAAAQDWSPGTRDSFGYHLKRLERFLGAKRRLEQVDQLALQRLRNDLVGSYATETATIGLHYATAIMRAAYHTNRIRRDVTIGVKAPTRRGDEADERVGPDDVPTRDEVLAIVAAAPPRFRAAIALGACGLRIGEVMGTTVGQLDLEQRMLAVDRQLVRIDNRFTFKRPKREKVRTIELPGWAILELRRHLRDHGPFWKLHGDPTSGDLLFRGSRDAPLRRDYFYASAWRPALVAAGMPRDAYVFHSLRHWCASALLAGNVHVAAVAGHLGDVSETVNRTYAHWLRDDRSVPAAVLDRALAPSSTEVAL